MKLWLGIGATLLIGASTYAFCPPKQNSVTTVTAANGVCVACPPTPPAATQAPQHAAKMMLRQGTTRARLSDEMKKERETLEKARAELAGSMVRAQHADHLAELDKRQAELNAVQAALEARHTELRSRAAEMGVETNKLRGAIERNAVERALKATRALDADKMKVMTEHLRVASELVPATQKAMMEAQRALEQAAAHGVVVATDAACDEACQEACEAACADACEAASTDACDAACAEACEAACDDACEAATVAGATVATVLDEVPVGEWTVGDAADGVIALTQDGKAVSTYSVDATADDDGVVVLEDGEGADVPSVLALGGGSKMRVLGSGENGAPKVRVMRVGGGLGGGDKAPSARAMVRSGGTGAKLARIAPGAYKIDTSGTGNGAGEHAQILDQLKMLTEEVRALREEVRALRSGNRVTETY